MEKNVENVKAEQEKFGELIQSEFERIEHMKADNEVTDFDKLEKIVIGVLPGDGIGPIIMKQALRVLNDLLAPAIAGGRIEIREIEGMTIENRAAKLQSLPDEVFEEIKKCNVIIKGPMVTPRAGEPWPNLVSANSLLRSEMQRMCQNNGLTAYMPPLRLCTDNAAMIGSAAFYRLMRGEIAALDLNAMPMLTLDMSAAQDVHNV